MRRSPIVIAATVAGTAGVLAFHAQAPAVQTATATTATTPAATATATATSTTSSGSSPGSASRTATGDAIDTRYGPAQVKVTVKNGKIVSVEAVELQSGDPHSAQISSSAAPVLQQEILSKQSAGVDA